MRQPKLGDLRCVVIALTFPLGRYGNSLDRTDTLDPIPHLHIVILEIHENTLRIVNPFRIVHLAVAVGPVETLGAIYRVERSVHLKILVQERKRQIYFVPFAPTPDRILLVDDAVDFLRQFQLIVYTIAENVKK